MQQFESRFAGDGSFFRRLMEAAPDAIVVVDKAGTIVLVNSQTEKLFGYPREELLGQPIEVLVPQRFQSPHSDHRHGYSAQPRVREMGTGLVLYAVRKNGEEFPVEISLSPIQTGTETLVSSSIRDVTERIRAEQMLREQSLELERASHAKERADEFRRLQDEIQRQRLRVFKATMRTVQDIVNNLLNSFELVRLESGDQLPAETLALIDRAIEEAAAKLKTLGDLETVKEKEMAIGLGIDYPDSQS